MTMFSIRIELHDASRNQYLDLYKRLTSVGITDLVVGNDGRRYRLPPAEYSLETPATIEQVRQLAQTCAGSVVANYAVLVSETGRRAWFGLEQIP